MYNVNLPRSMLIAYGRGKRFVKCTECGELFGVQVESKMDYLFDQILRCPNCVIKTDHEVWDQINKVEL